MHVKKSLTVQICLKQKAFLHSACFNCRNSLLQNVLASKTKKRFNEKIVEFMEARWIMDGSDAVLFLRNSLSCLLLETAIKVNYIISFFSLLS